MEDIKISLINKFQKFDLKDTSSRLKNKIRKI